MLTNQFISYTEAAQHELNPYYMCMRETARKVNIFIYLFRCVKCVFMFEIEFRDNMHNYVYNGDTTNDKK